MKNKPFPNLDGREEKTRQLRQSAIALIGSEEEYDSASYMERSLACRASVLDWIMENEKLSVSELTQANNAYIGIVKKISEQNKHDRVIPKVTKDELLEAIHEGVKSAIWDVATNASDMPCSDFYSAIKNGVEDAVCGMGGNIL